MKTLQIATLGLYENQRVDYAATKRSVDKLVVIGTKENESEVEEMTERYKQLRIPFEAVQVSPWKFKSTLAAVMDVVARHPDYDVEFNVSCGTRLMAGATHMAAIFINAPLIFVGESEEGEEYELTVVSAVDGSILTAGRRETLAALADMGGKCDSITELAEEAGYSRGMVTRHVNALRRAGLVEKSGSRPVSVLITELGKIVLRVKSLRKERIWGRK